MRREGWSQGKARACYVGSRPQRAAAILRAIREAPLTQDDLEDAKVEIEDEEGWDNMPERGVFLAEIDKRLG